MPIKSNVVHFDHLVYVRIFEGCNLSCQHCFIPANPKKMTLAQIREIPSKVREFAKEGSTILIQWHGGEPTLLGPDFIESGIETLKEDQHFNYIHGIQTNLTTYDDDWRALFSTHFKHTLGVSWDPVIRQFRTGDKDFEAFFWGRYQQVIDDGLSPLLIVTATKLFFNFFRNPFLFFDFLEKRNVFQVHLERITPTGYAMKNWAQLGLTNREYAQSMAYFFKCYASYIKSKHGEKRLHISPFDDLISSVQSLKAGTPVAKGCLSDKCDTKFHTIDSSGYKSGCTAITAEIDNSSSSQSFVINDIIDTRNKRKRECSTCTFSSICSTGCMTLDRTDISGECSGAYELFQQVFNSKI